MTREGPAHTPPSTRRLTLLLGAPGAGRSRLLDQTRARGAVTLVRVHPCRTQTLGLARDLVRAFVEAAPALEIGFASAATTATRGSRHAARLGAWLGRNLPYRDGCEIVLDDLHLLDGEPESRALLVALIDAAPARARFTLGLRASDAWPLATWLARDIVALPARELQAETPRAGDERVTAIARGWMAGLEPDRRAIAMALAAADSLDEPHLLALPHARAAIGAFGGRYSLCRSGDRLRAAYARGILSYAPVSLRAVPDLWATLFALPARARYEIVLAAGDSGDARAVLDAEGFAAIDAHLGDVVERLVARLDTEDRSACAVAVLSRAMHETEFGRHDVAESWFVHAAGIAPDARSRGRIEFEHGSDLLRRGRPDCVVPLERAARLEATSPFGPLASAALAGAYAATGRWEEARVTLARALSSIDAHDAAVRARVYRQAAYVLLRDERPGEADVYARRAIELADRLGLDDIVAAALSVLVVVASSYRDDDVAAMEHLTRLESHAARLENVYLVRYARLARLELFGDRGAWDRVDELEHDLAGQELANDAVHASQTLTRTRALRAAGSGRFREALAELRSGDDLSPFPDLCALRHAEIASYAAALGDGTAARLGVEAAERDLAGCAGSASATVARTRLALSLARSLLGSGRTPEATKGLDEGLARFPRLRTFERAVEAAAAYRLRPDDGEGVAYLAALAEVQSAGLGGLAAFLRALPASAAPAVA